MKSTIHSPVLHAAENERQAPAPFAVSLARDGTLTTLSIEIHVRSEHESQERLGKRLHTSMEVFSSRPSTRLWLEWPKTAT